MGIAQVKDMRDSTASSTVTPEGVIIRWAKWNWGGPSGYKEPSGYKGAFIFLEGGKCSVFGKR